MTNIDFVPAVYAAVVIASFAVVWIYGAAAIRTLGRLRTARQSDMLIAGVCLAFADNVVYFSYWIAWRLGPEWMADALVGHWVIAIFGAVKVSAALLHIRAATEAQCGESGWIRVLSLSVGGATVVLALTMALQ